MNTAILSSVVGFGSLTILLTIILAFEIWMFVDLLQNKKLSTETKVLWAVGMFLIHPFVAIVYYFVARSNKS